MKRQRHRAALNRVINKIVKVIAEEVEEEATNERVWVRPWINRRDTLGMSSSLLKELAVEDKAEYFNAFRMSEESFNVLLQKVCEKIQRKDTHIRSAIPAETKLQTVLYFLATGCSLRTLQHLFRLGKSTISEFIPEVCQAVSESLKDFIKVPDENEWKHIQDGFRRECNFPGCCGAIDGKHVAIKAPADCGSLYYNYKQSNSIVLMAVVDHNYCFKYIDIGCNGRISDGGVFRHCNIYQALENGMLPTNHFLVGDNAFPMKDY